MADGNASPPSARRTRTGSIKGSGPAQHHDDGVPSSKGQFMSQSRSTTSLVALRSKFVRQRSSFGSEYQAHPRRSQESEDQEHAPETPQKRQYFLYNGASDDHDDMRRMSLTPAVMTPHNEMPNMRSGFRWPQSSEDDHESLRRISSIPAAMTTPQMRTQRLIGNTNPRYRWEQYWKTDRDLKEMKKSVRRYYERTNYLIQNYLYIDRLLDSSLPHNLLQEYDHTDRLNRTNVPATIAEESSPGPSPQIDGQTGSSAGASDESNLPPSKLKRTPKDLYRIKDESVKDAETTPLLSKPKDDGDAEEQLMPPDLDFEDEADSSSRIVQIAIYVNLVANTILLIMKIVVVALSSSVSVLASLVDAALDFLSTAIVWTTTRLISQNDQYAYPIGRRRLEPVGVLVFSIIMITSFVQVGLEGINKLAGDDHAIVRLTIPAIAIMVATVVIKGLCWLWCRLIKNSSVQALAQDAMTDVVFNIFSIIFPLVGFYARVWWLDPLGGILLSLWVIVNWAQTSSTHIRNLTGAAASADERNILLYLTMRFARTIHKIQGLQAYHSGDKLNVEVDIVLDEHTNLRDSHDLGESLQYVLESVPTVDRAFVHMDYLEYNLPSHMQQDS